MALPTQIRNALDNLYDKLQGMEDGQIVTDRISLSGRIYKVRFSKGGGEDNWKYKIEIIDRTPPT